MRISASPCILAFVALLGCSDDVGPSSSDDGLPAATDEPTSGDSGAEGTGGSSATAVDTTTASTPATGSSETGSSETGADTGAPVFILNGSFEVPDLEPDCYHNLTNDEVEALIPDVFGLGSANQVDLYADCFVETADGFFHVGLGADGDDGDALALALSGPLKGPYRIHFLAQYGETGAAVSTDVSVGLSSEVESGVEVGRTGPLTEARTEYTVDVVGQGETFITLAVVPDGDLGWAMIDAVQLEAL